MRLNYFWTATYKDGTTMSQFENGTEKLFKDINQSELKSFYIKGFQHPNHLGIDLTTGRVFLNGTFLRTNLFDNHVGLRLIYFRQNRASISMTDANLFSNGHNHMKHYIGFQTTQNDKNKKLLLSVDNETNETELMVE